MALILIVAVWILMLSLVAVLCVAARRGDGEASLAYMSAELRAAGPELAQAASLQLALSYPTPEPSVAAKRPGAEQAAPRLHADSVAA